MVKLIAAQEDAIGEIDLAPLLSEVTFLSQIHEGQQDDCSEQTQRESEENRDVEMVLVNCSALHMSIYFDLENVARVLLPQAGVALHVASGPK